MLKGIIKGILGISILATTVFASRFDELSYLGQKILERGGECRNVSVGILDKAHEMGLEAKVFVFATHDKNVTHSVVVVYDGKLWRVYDFIRHAYVVKGEVIWNG